MKPWNKVYKLLERGWTQGVEARTSGGVPCHATASEAVSWCMTGAIKVADDGNYDIWDEMVEQLQNLLRKSISEWNDTPGRTKDEVLAIVKTLIEMEEKNAVGQ